MTMHRVFVYGTLMKGLRNSHFLDNARFVSETQTADSSYEMIQFPSTSSPGNITPGVVKNGKDRIAGEIYLVDDHTLALLDKLEEVGTEYTRERVTLKGGCSALTYFLIADKPACPKGTPNFVSFDMDTKTCFWDGAREESVNSEKKKVA